MPVGPTYERTGESPATFTYKMFHPTTDGVAVNVTSPVSGTYEDTVQFDTSALVVFKYTTKSVFVNFDAAPAPPSVAVCVLATPTLVVPSTVDCRTCTSDGRPNVTVLVSAVAAKYTVSVPVESPGVGVYENVKALDDVVPDAGVI